MSSAVRISPTSLLRSNPAHLTTTTTRHTTLDGTQPTFTETHTHADTITQFWFNRRHLVPSHSRLGQISHGRTCGHIQSRFFSANACCTTNSDKALKGIRSTDSNQEKERKRKVEYLYSAILVCHTHKALRHGSHSFTCKLHHACLSFVSVHQMAPPLSKLADIQLQLTTH